MSMIKEINLKLKELEQEVLQLEKAGYTPENLQRVQAITKQVQELKAARRMRQRQLGMHET